MNSAFHTKLPIERCRMRFQVVLIPITAIAAVLSLSACSSQSKEKHPTAAVESALVQQKTIQRTIQTEAILFPLHQSALVPKISAPVRKFYVNRGSHVRSGQLLAVLENRDLV